MRIHNIVSNFYLFNIGDPCHLLGHWHFLARLWHLCPLRPQFGRDFWLDLKYSCSTWSNFDMLLLCFEQTRYRVTFKYTKTIFETTSDNLNMSGIGKPLFFLFAKRCLPFEVLLSAKEAGVALLAWYGIQQIVTIRHIHILSVWTYVPIMGLWDSIQGNLPIIWVISAESQLKWLHNLKEKLKSKFWIFWNKASAWISCLVICKLKLRLCEDWLKWNLQHISC